MDFYDDFVPDDTFSSLIQGTKIFTDLSELVSQLSNVGIDGPQHFKEPNLDSRGRLIGRGAQFEVFEDTLGFQKNVVYKRVRVNGPIEATPNDIKSHLRTLQLEIASLCDPLRRSNNNIVQLTSWGYDYPSSNLSFRLPVLCMEKAIYTLEHFLQRDQLEGSDPAISYQLCLDIASGLHGIHLTGLVHADLKPANVLIFSRSNEYVPFIAKLSDFGKCIEINETVKSFAVYTGTPGWKPPEVEGNHHELSSFFKPSLMLRTESYAYGLLAISVLAFQGRVVPKQETIGTDAFWQFVSGETGKLPTYIEACLQTVMTRFLSQRPEDRLEVNPDVMKCEDRYFTNWQLATRQPRAHLVEAKSTTGNAYYVSLDPAVLTQLETQISQAASTPDVFSNELLLGMAIRVMSLKGSRHRQRALQYFQAAAERSNLAVKGISARISNAADSNQDIFAPDSNIEQWLFESGSRGSLMALEDLYERDPELAGRARQEFVRLGGFNKNMSLTIRDRTTSVSSASIEDLNSPLDNCGNTYLHYAASYDLISSAEWLVSNGASINQQNHQGETPLYKACLAAHVGCVRILTKLGADASIPTTEHGISCLHWLFNFDEDNIREVVELLVSRGAQIGALTQCLSEGKVTRHIPSEFFPFYWPQGAPIHWACTARSLAAVDALLENGASVNDLDGTGLDNVQTALSMAAYRGDSRIVKHLLSRGADPNYQDSKGRTAAHMMAIPYYREENLLRLPQGLKWWIYHGSWQNHVQELTECAHALIRWGGDLNAQTRYISAVEDLVSPILDAVENRNAGATLALLNAGASVNCTMPPHAERPIHAWVNIDSDDLPYLSAFRATCQILLQNTPDLDVRDSRQKSILHHALRPGNLNDFEYLLSLMAQQQSHINLEVVDEDNETPLLKAANMKGSTTSGYFQAVAWTTLLLDRGADITAKDYDDCNLLLLACHNTVLPDSECLSLIKKALQKHSLDFQRELVQKSVSRKDGMTALMYACWNSLPNVATFLLELGADVNAVSTAGQTVLDVALDTSQFIRQQRLDRWIMFRTVLLVNGKFSINGLDEHKDVLTSPAVFLNSAKAVDRLFQVTVTESDVTNKLFEDGRIEAEKYFGCMQIVRHLRSVGALQAKNLISHPAKYSTFAPARWDAQMVVDANGDLDGFVAENQPFYEEHWKLLYELRPWTGFAAFGMKMALWWLKNHRT